MLLDPTPCTSPRPGRMSCLCLLAALLAGCGEETGADTTEDEDEVQASQDDAPSDGDVSEPEPLPATPNGLAAGGEGNAAETPEPVPMSPRDSGGTRDGEPERTELEPEPVREAGPEPTAETPRASEVLDAGSPPDLTEPRSSADAGIDASGQAPDAQTNGCVAVDFVDTEGAAREPLCPIDPLLPECASSDVGALVARGQECLDATLAAHQCSPWPDAADDESFETEMLVLIPYDRGCETTLTVDSVMECEDHVAIEYSVPLSCSECDATRDWLHSVHIANTSKPMIVEGAVLEPASCP